MNRDINSVPIFCDFVLCVKVTIGSIVVDLKNGEKLRSCCIHELTIYPISNES